MVARSRIGQKKKSEFSSRGSLLRFPSVIGQNQVLIERRLSCSVDRGHDSGECALHVWALCPIGKILDLICVVQRHLLSVANRYRSFGFDNGVQRLLPKAGEFDQPPLSPWREKVLNNIGPIGGKYGFPDATIYPLRSLDNCEKN